MIIGIDIGVNCGVALYNSVHNKLDRLMTLNTYEVIVMLQKYRNSIEFVVIEDSRKQSYIWNKTKGTAPFGRQARNIGSVDGRAGVLEEACKELDIRLERISPLEKGKKWSNTCFSYFAKILGFNSIQVDDNIEIRKKELVKYLINKKAILDEEVEKFTTNQHERDAAACIFTMLLHNKIKFE